MTRPLLLVGDNPFLGISHLSQERARRRSALAGSSRDAAEIVLAAMDHGADGFMFSVTGTTLSILQAIGERCARDRLKLIPLIPYAHEWVRHATFDGGVAGIGKRYVRDLLASRNLAALGRGLRGVLRADLSDLLESHVAVELSKVASLGRGAELVAVMLHEVVTDLAVALDLGWVVRRYVGFLHRQGLRAGLETRNFCSLVQRLRAWDVDLGQVAIAAPFNEAGFQMVPSRADCERVLASMPPGSVVAMSIFAGGYVPPNAALEYVRRLPNLGAVVAGVSSVAQSRETFRLLREGLAT